MAWGQGELISTPAGIARLASGIANNGTLLPNRYVLKISDSIPVAKSGIQLTKNPEYAKLITDFMIKQSAGKAGLLKIAVAGKTGTPERIWKKEPINDGWYVFFAPKGTGSGNMVVCIRVESTKGSSDAVLLASKHVIPFLVEKKYIKSMPSSAGTTKARGNLDTATEAIVEEVMPVE